MGENTVFICVPDLQAIPVGRRSTALASTRRHFQFGLTSPIDDAEIAFDDLEQVRELVRRGYLAGGLGPDGPVLPPEPIPGPTPFDGPEPVQEEYDLRISEGEDLEWTDGTDPASDLRQLAESVRRFSFDETLTPARVLAQALERLIITCAKIVTRTWFLRVGQGSNALDDRLYADWCSVLDVLRMESVWDDTGDTQDYGSFESWAYRSNYRPIAQPDTSLSAVVHAAPVPRRAHWRTGLTRLEEKLLLPMVENHYFLANRRLPELAPSALAALIMTARQVAEPGWFSIRLPTALEWLAEEISGVSLPAPAEAAISEYVSRRLGD